MAITNIRVFPSIGVARLGNSPTDFFIGPEIPGQIPNPQGGYKDDQCRIKRQAARFRLFGYDGNTLVQEITAADAAISWTVHLVHGKAAHHGSDPSRTINPGARTIIGPLQQAKFNTGTFGYGTHTPVSVDLGEIRTDTDGRLLVLGGFGKAGTADPSQASSIGSFLSNPAWYDDACDGSISATVVIDGNNIPVMGAWVLVGPPDFAPEIGNAISLYDRLKQYHADNGLLPAGFPLPTDASYQPSFSKDIYPLLKRAWEDVQEVLDVVPAEVISLNYSQLSNPAASSQAARTAAMQELKRNGGKVPRSAIEASFQDVTDLQYAMLAKWEAGNFINDWTGPPAPSSVITPEGLTQAALENTTGGRFYPGIEGGNQLVNSPSRYMAGELLRIDHAQVSAGELTKDMAVPWQADFTACSQMGGCAAWVETAWWPAQRPIKVLDASTNTKLNWQGSVGSYLDMVHNWQTLGFVVKNQGVFQDTERCDTASVTLLTPSLNFGVVALGPGGLPRPVALAIQFEVISPGATQHFTITSLPSPTNLQPLFPGPFPIGPSPANASQQLLIPIRYVATNEGDSISASITIQHTETGRVWTIPISASTGSAVKHAISLVLDRSGSMNQDRGDGLPKVQSMREAAGILVDLMVQGDGISLARYNNNAQEVLPVTEVGPSDDPLDPGRTLIKNKVNGTDFSPSGGTSIGDGIVVGRTSLNNSSGFDSTSMIILTDGKENRPQYIAEVANQLNEQTYAVGLGQPSNINVTSLQSLTGNTGGYLLISGSAITGDNRFRLQKYFMQILAGITNKEIIFDPEGRLQPNQTDRVSFTLSDAESGVDVILLTSRPEAIRFSLQGPNGQIIDETLTANHPGIRRVISQGIVYYRFALPIEVSQDRYEFAGTWQTIISYPTARKDRDRASILYSLNVHAYSNLRTRLSAQPCQESGSAFVLQGDFSQYGNLPVSQVSMWAEVTLPNGTVRRLSLPRNEQDQFHLRYGDCQAGLHAIRLLARGKTLSGTAFQREQLFSFPMVAGGDQPETDGKWEVSLPDPAGDFLVYGQITDKKGNPLPNIRIKAVDQDFTGENPLGKEAKTDVEGRYRIPYRDTDFIIDGKESGGADIILYLYDTQGERIHQTEPKRNSPQICEINVALNR